jgi:glycosyltransferase involved in cell wall biosynthesis
MLTIGIIGTRGIPNNHGGFERFVELLVAEDIWRSQQISIVVYSAGADGYYNEWTRIRNIGFSKDERPFWYYYKSTWLATRECDVIVCCGCGLSVFAFWPVLRGKSLVVNPDGCEWRRTKWSWIGRLAIRTMYVPALAAATRIVIDAEALRDDFGRALDKKARYIGYQAPQPNVNPMRDVTREHWGLFRPYVLVIARLEPENNIHLVVQAFRQVQQGGMDLIVVGGITTPFYKQVLAPLAAQHVRFVGAIYDQLVLDELRSNCLAYVHGHSVGGTNPSLLEALATVRGRLLCHDNKYNREVASNEAGYFADERQLADLLHPLLDSLADREPAHRIPSRDKRFYPETIARRYLELFEDIRTAS